MKPQAWIIATVISAITMTIGLVSYTHGYVYTRTEAQTLSRKVELNTSDLKDMNKNIYDELIKIRTHIGKIEGKLSRQD